MRSLCLAALVVGIAVVAPAVAWADSGYEDDDLSVRLASAFIRFTEVSAFGGETAANRWSPSVNPAAADWACMESRAGVALAGYWAHHRFDTDNVIDVVDVSGLWDTRRFGSLNVNLIAIRSNEEEDKQGLVFDYETDTIQVQYAKRFGSWAAGIAFNYADSTVEQRTGGTTAFRSTADTYRYRAGVLWEPACKWLLGLAGEYATSPYEYSALVLTPGGPMVVQGDDTQDQVVLRGGVSYEYRPYSVAYVDYQYAYFDNERQDLTIHRVSAGVQHNLFRFLFLRAGATIDQESNLGLLAGIGAAFAKWGSIDLGYQYNTLPELDPNFGTSHVFQVILAVRF